MIYVGATLERGHASPLLLFVARNGSSCHVHKGHVEFYLRQWAKKGDEVVSPLDSFHLSFPASRFPSHGSPRPRANLRATISVPFHFSFLLHLSVPVSFLCLPPSHSLSCSLFLFLPFRALLHGSLARFLISVCLFLSPLSLLRPDPALRAVSLFRSPRTSPRIINPATREDPWRSRRLWAESTAKVLLR